MRTGILGSFVISWSQTEVDGLARAPRGALAVGATWRWSGDAVRVDGPHDVVRLALGAGEADIRKRAGRKVGRLVGLPLTPDAQVVDPKFFELGFVVTDGRLSYEVSLIEGAGMSETLLMFHDGLPPTDRELWVVDARLEAVEINRQLDQPTGVICFTPGTRIRTEGGDKRVEDIHEGERVQTKDNGLQEVRWIGQKRITGARLYAMPELRPVRVRAGALGQDRPDGDLIVSPAHRMLVKGARAQALFGTEEVLVSASDLIDDRFVSRDRTLSQVTYIHLLLDHHEIVFANGLETESFLPEGEALAAVEAEQRNRLFDQWPELKTQPGVYGSPARRLLSKAEAAIMGAVH